MDQQIATIIEFFIISFIGTLFHFTYEWSHHNKIVGLFSAVNESTWEHIKLALSAFFLCSAVDGFFWAANPNYYLGKFLALIIVIITIPLIFYTYTAVTKKSILFIDISSFFIAIALGQYVFYTAMNVAPLPQYICYLGLLGVFAVFGFYMVVTLLPMRNFIFKDPITHKYGLRAHSDKKTPKTK